MVQRFVHPACQRQTGHVILHVLLFTGSCLLSSRILCPCLVEVIVHTQPCKSLLEQYVQQHTPDSLFDQTLYLNTFGTQHPLKVWFKRLKVPPIYKSMETFSTHPLLNSHPDAQSRIVVPNLFPWSPHYMCL